MAGCCNLTLSGIAKDCSLNRGGILQVWMSPCMGVTATETDGVVTITGADWHEYEVQPVSSEFTTSIANDISAGTSNLSTTINLQFAKMTVQKNQEINQLLIGGMVMVVRDANNEYWYFGYDEPVYMTDSTAQTGTAREDLNGYNLALIDYSREMPYGVAAASRPDAEAPAED